VGHLTVNQDELLQSARALFQAEQSQDLRGLIAEKMEDLGHYDLPAMNRVVAVLAWGRSGSLLLSSYLDGHEDVMMLPELCGWRLYEFFERYPSMPLREKLTAFPAYDPLYGRFFDGDFAISSVQYYAAVEAILEYYGKLPPEVLQSRRVFFLLVHIAYNLALGRRPGNACPLIVYAQHEWDDKAARQLVEDFPQAKFIHTIRDPLSCCNGMFHFLLYDLAEPFPRAYTLAPYGALLSLANRDRSHSGMESVTRTIRFEDMHRDVAETMRDVADWLGLPYQPTLLDSTFNGIPWVVKRYGKAWSGQRLEQAQRRAPHLSPKDRALLFAAFYENFVDWNYPCPKIFGNPVVRWFIFVTLFALPTRMEFIAARRVFIRWILPALRERNISRATRSVLGIGFYRVKIVGLLAPAFFRRWTRGANLLQVVVRRPSSEPDRLPARAAHQRAESTDPRS
jgi:Sulfotransferase family